MKAFSSAKTIAVLALVSSFAFANTTTFADEPAYASLESTLAAAHKAQDQADALYDLAKAHFDNRDYAEAESLMHRSLDLEKTLKRPTSFLRTEVALATMLAAENKTQDAKQLYQDALAFAHDHKMNADAITITNNLGLLCLQLGDPEKAAQLYREALASAQADNMPAQEASALINLAVVQRAQNQTEAAMASLNQALPLVQKNGSDSAVGNIYMEMGRAQADSGKLEEALASYDQAKEHFAQDFDNISQGKAVMASGQLLLTREKLAEASAKLSEAAKILTPEAGTQASPILIDCLTSLAATYTAQKQFDDSDATIKQALAYADTLNNFDRKREVLSELGYLAIVRGQPEQALANYLKAYDELPKDNTKPTKIRAVLLSDLAMCYKALGQLDLAINNYNQSFSMLAALGDIPAQATTANNLAVAYLDSGKMTDFNSVWHQAQALYVQANDKKGEALLSYNLGQSKLFCGNATDSIADYQHCLSMMRALNDSSGISQTLRGLGLAYLLAAKPDQALTCYKEALPLAEQAGNAEAEWDCQLGLGKAYKALGQKDEALNHLRKAVSEAEAERGQLSRDTFKTFNLDMRQDCFYELVDLLISENQTDETLEVAERSRARAFADLLSARKGSVGHLLDASSDNVSTVKSAPLPQGLSSSQEFATASTTIAQALSTDEIKQLVKEHNSICIEYYCLPDKLVLWVIDANGIVHLLPPQPISARKLRDKVTDLYNAIIAQPKTLEEIKQSGTLRQTKLKEMYKLLLGPAEAMLPQDKPVIIVPHGPLFLVPFAALMDSKGKFLVEAHTLSVTPAISILQATAKLEDSALKDNKLLAFGNPTTEAFASLGSLPYAETEVQKAAEIFGAANAVIEVKGQANRATFIKLAPQTAIVHMACHGIINEEHPTLSGLVLAKDGKDTGFVTVKDILNLPPLQSRLVVLSACQTGRGKITGDGVIGLSRAFIAAGTPSVIVSQWNVDDVIAEFQMESFYKNLLGGKSKADSLRQAQLETISSMEGSMADTSSPTFIRANPRYWAAFQLIGEAR